MHASKHIQFLKTFKEKCLFIPNLFIYNFFSFVFRKVLIEIFKNVSNFFFVFNIKLILKQKEKLLCLVT